MWRQAGRLEGDQSSVQTDTSAAEPLYRRRQDGLQDTNRRRIGLDFLDAALKDTLIRTHYLTTCRSSPLSIRLPDRLTPQKHDVDECSVQRVSALNRRGGEKKSQQGRRCVGLV